MAEIKGRDPIRTAQSAGFLSILITSVLYLTTVVSFVVVMTKEEILDAGEVLGARFLRKIYGDAIADKLFLMFIGMTSFGGTISFVRTNQLTHKSTHELTECPLDLIVRTDAERGWKTGCTPVYNILEPSQQEVSDPVWSYHTQVDIERGIVACHPDK
jgi:hypothetical protein